MRRPAETERQLHEAVAAYLALALPADAVWTTFPAGEYRTKATGGRLKGMGLKRGWPDLQILYAGRLHGLELKTRKGRLSPEQAERHREIREAGGVVEVCRSLAEVELALAGWGVPLRASTMEAA